MPLPSTPPVVLSPEEWATSGFTAAEMARPLRRGAEVARFNELATSQDELPSSEADELYRFRLRRVMSRLRQLARVCTRSDEEGIRASLDDLDGRLVELRRLEDARQREGLPTGYQLDLEQRQAAIDQLLELARRRVPGLVAGSDMAPTQPGGDVRLPMLAFQATPDDVPVYIVAPQSIPSKTPLRSRTPVPCLPWCSTGVPAIHCPPT
jgi:hypothetical protein